jgi:hypothetical protein
MALTPLHIIETRLAHSRAVQKEFAETLMRVVVLPNKSLATISLLRALRDVDLALGKDILMLCCTQLALMREGTFIILHFQRSGDERQSTQHHTILSKEPWPP